MIPAKPFIAVLLLFIILCGPANAQSLAAGTTTPVNTGTEKPEFPRWLLDLRRAEIVAFGSFPFMMFLATFSMDTYRASGHNWDNRYLPWPLKGPGAVAMSTDEHLVTLGVAIAGSVLVALADHLIVRVKRARLERQRQDLPEGELIILRKPWPNEEAESQDIVGEDAAPEPEP
jgi:hypothetical protein